MSDETPRRLSIELIPEVDRQAYIAYIQKEAFIISVEPYVHHNCPYEFDIHNDGNVFVRDDNFDTPQRLSHWMSKLVEFSEVEHMPADVAELALDVQRRLTTEQGDFTTLIIASGAFRNRSRVKNG